MSSAWERARWPVVRIRDIGVLHGGGTPNRDRSEFFEGVIPWITSQDIPETHVMDVSSARHYVTQDAITSSATKLVPAGTVLVSTRVTVGKTAVAATPLCFSQDITAILIHAPAIASPHYVAWFLRSRRESLVQKNQGSTIAGITRDALELEQIPLPPLSEQHRIVEILREAEEIRRLRAQAETKTAELIPALFADIFLKDKKGLKSFPQDQLGSQLEKIETGWSPVASGESAGANEWGVLKLGAVSFGVYSDEENKALLSETAPRADLEVQNDDLLLVRKNTRELVGAVAYVWNTRKHLIFSDLIFRLSLRPDSEINSLFAVLSG